MARHLAGWCGVDAGLILIGDPCYSAYDGDADDHPIHNWSNFCDMLEKHREKTKGDARLFKQLDYTRGHEGLGVVMESGFGDGMYPVYVTVKDMGRWGKRVTKAEIIFDEE